jgi:hypothetical protein
MATAVLAPVKWNTGRRLHVINSNVPAQTSQLNNIQKWRQEEAVRVAEESGNFLTISHSFIIDQLIKCQLPHHASDRQEVAFAAVYEQSAITLEEEEYSKLLKSLNTPFALVHLVSCVLT